MQTHKTIILTSDPRKETVNSPVLCQASDGGVFPTINTNKSDFGSLAADTAEYKGKLVNTHSFLEQYRVFRVVRTILSFHIAHELIRYNVNCGNIVITGYYGNWIKTPLKRLMTKSIALFQ